MRILFLGDVMGRPGRELILSHLPGLRRKLQAEFVVVNCENAAHGFGIMPAMCDALFDAGCDVLTSGNHIWDKQEILEYSRAEPRLLRPANMKGNVPGSGMRVFDGASGERILVINIVGRMVYDAIDDPFTILDEALPDSIPIQADLDAVIIDVHGERTSDKTAFGVLADGRASLVAGTHIHIPTADHRILPGGTGFQCDVGMCGAYDSVIGMDKNLVLNRMMGQLPRPRLTPARGAATICGVLIETDPKTG
ncbi:MAG: TIGR00282 family metallophosphoesterase, partial [Pseudomonadota bacterium]